MKDEFRRKCLICFFSSTKVYTNKVKHWVVLHWSHLLQNTVVCTFKMGTAFPQDVNVCVYRGKGCLTAEKIPVWKKKMELNLQLSYPWLWEYYLCFIVCSGFCASKILLHFPPPLAFWEVTNHHCEQYLPSKFIFPVSGCWFCSLKDLLFFLLRQSHPKHRGTHRVGNNHDNESCSLREAKQVAWLKPMPEWQKILAMIWAN